MGEKRDFVWDERFADLMGGVVDMKLVSAVVEATHRYKEIFYTE